VFGASAIGAQRLLVIDEVEEPVLEAAIEAVGDRKSLTGLARHVDDEIRAHAGPEDDATARHLVRCDRLAVVGDHLRAMRPEFECENPCVGDIDEPQPDALP
jgi:hypothetical protein